MASSEAGVRAWTAAVAAAAGCAVGAIYLTSGWPSTIRGWWVLPIFSVLIAAAQRLRVRIRFGDQVDAVNLMEAVLAPLLFAFPPLVVVVVVAGAQVITTAFRRGSAVKNLFNLASWVLASGCGALVLQTTGAGALTASHLLRLFAALATVGAVNLGAFFVVLTLARAQSPWSLSSEMKRVIAIAWGGGWALNLLFGYLYVLAFSATEAATVLFAVPLVVLHLAYRGLAAVTADQQRLAGLHEAAETLASPVDPKDGIGDFLEAVARGFDCRSALLVLGRAGGHVVHAWDRSAEPRYSTGEEDGRTGSIEEVLASLPGPVHIKGSQKHPLAELIRARGWMDCMSAPLVEQGRATGCLVVVDQGGPEGLSRGELAVLEALARETAGTFAKGRLLADVLDERRKLADLIDATSDGMLSLDTDGSPLAWNPALTRITGVAAESAIGQPGAIRNLQFRTLDGRPLDLTRWPDLPDLPADVRISTADDTQRRLSCSYSRVRDEGEAPRVLVVVIRDLTAHDEMAALREEFDRLTEEEAAARAAVEQLQQAVVPPAPEVPAVDMAVEYLPSDDVAPTGGDLYDWHALPNGDMHLAVVDVLGHGISATKAALSVIHTLRTVAVEGTPLAEIIGRADRLLQAQDPNLVATAVVGRYTPSTGKLQIASGGHPPALVIRGDGPVELADATGGTIGWPGAGSDAISEFTLEVGDAMVLYTDGLVESRKNLLEGLETLVTQATGTGEIPTCDLPGVLVRRMLQGAQRRDDTLALVLRRTTSASTLAMTVAPRPEEVRRARDQVGWWLGSLGYSTGDAVAAAAELLANSARSARSRVRLAAQIGTGTLSLSVSDDGPGDPLLPSRGMFDPGPDAEHGRGLYMVRALTSSFEAESSPSGSRVMCQLPLQELAATAIPLPEVPHGLTGGND